MTDATARYLEVLVSGRRPVRAAAARLADALAPAASAGARREAAALAVAVAAAVIPCALARHAARRGGAAAWEVVEKFGRAGDLDEPRIGVRAQLDRPRFDPRLGGLLGDEADRIAAGLAARTGLPAADLARAVAAVAPMMLAALARACDEAAGLASALTDFPVVALDGLARLEPDADGPREVLARVVRRARARRGFGLLGVFGRRARRGIQPPPSPGRSGGRSHGL